MSPLLLSLLCLAGEPSPEQNARPAEASVPPAQAVIPIETGRDAAVLCGALTPVERMRFKGDAVQRGKAEVAHETRREAVLAARYRTRIPGARLAFDPYDSDGGKLVLARSTELATADGKLRVWPGEPLGVEADAAVAQRILQAQKERTLALLLVYEVASDDGTSCTKVSGMRSFTLNVDPVSWEYVSGSTVLARGGEGADRPLVSASQGARRRVEVAVPIAEASGLEIRRRVEARAKELDRCYADALAKEPALDGSLVSELRLAEAGGVPERTEIVADSVLSEPLAACVKGVLARTEFPGGKAQRAAIPIRFILEPPGEAGARP